MARLIPASGWQTGGVTGIVPGPPVFVYGTLCIPEVRSTLLRRSVGATDAILDGAEVRRVHGHTYPTLVLRSTGHSVRGTILQALTTEERDVLRGFEPPTYDLVPIEVTNPSGRIACLTFVQREGLAVTVEPWTPEGFGGSEYRRFLDEVKVASERLWTDQTFALDARNRP